MKALREAVEVGRRAQELAEVETPARRGGAGERPPTAQGEAGSLGESSSRA